MSVITKESGHWYDADGKPAYTYENAKGETKNTTLRQARKANLFPSVTTVTKIIAAPGLEIWKQNQLLQAAANLPLVEGDTKDDWCKRVIADAGEYSNDAREKGTAIHGDIEKFFDGEHADLLYIKEAELVSQLLEDMGIKNIATENSFSSPYGYGGKVDFEGVDSNGRPVVIDFKTQDFKDKKKKQYPEMLTQLAAYSVGLGKSDARLINVFISRNLEQPEVDHYEWTPEECCLGWEKFLLILKLWQLEKNYKPKA